MFSHWIERPFSGLLNRLPSQCVVCRAWPAQPVCDACVARFAPPTSRCATCALQVADGVSRCSECTRTRPPLDACLAACTYAWPWPDCIAQFKFRGEAGWAGPLATLLRSAPWVEPALEQCDLVLPMPLAPGRLGERGFNQAHELARRLAPAKTDATLLLRTRDTPAQSGLPRADRLLRRAGLDYHEYAKVLRHRDWQALLDAERPAPERMFALTTRCTRPGAISNSVSPRAASCT